MENVVAPAIIAYQNGDVIAMLTDCSAVGLETNLRRSAMLFRSLSTILMSSRNGILVDTSY